MFICYEHYDVKKKKNREIFGLDFLQFSGLTVLLLY